MHGWSFIQYYFICLNVKELWVLVFLWCIVGRWYTHIWASSFVGNVWTRQCTNPCMSYGDILKTWELMIPLRFSSPMHTNIGFICAMFRIPWFKLFNSSLWLYNSKNENPMFPLQWCGNLLFGFMVEGYSNVYKQRIQRCGCQVDGRNARHSCNGQTRHSLLDSDGFIETKVDLWLYCTYPLWESVQH